MSRLGRVSRKWQRVLTTRCAHSCYGGGVESQDYLEKKNVMKWMYIYTCINEVPMLQQLHNGQGIIVVMTQFGSVHTGVHIRLIMSKRCQEGSWVISSRLCLQWTPQKMMTAGLVVGPLHKPKWLTAVWKWGEYVLTQEVWKYATYDGFVMSNPEPCGLSSKSCHYEEVQWKWWQERSTW